MVRSEALDGLGADAVSRMTGSVKTEEEKQQIAQELEAERKKQLQDQLNMGKLFLAIGGAIIFWGWLNNTVSWHFHYAAQLCGLRHFPMPADLVWARKQLVAWLLSGNNEEL